LALIVLADGAADAAAACTIAAPRRLKARMPG
jgi:hypothetical protein